MEKSNIDDLEARVSDIEKCIGDISKTLQDIEDALEGLSSPDCPPYCIHGIEPPSYEDPMTLQDRVGDICRHIGDFAKALKGVKKALSARVGPDCPPYCGHDSDSDAGGEEKLNVDPKK